MLLYTSRVHRLNVRFLLAPLEALEALVKI